MNTLLIGPNADRLRILSHTLAQRGHEVSLAEDAEAAARKTGAHPLVFVDVDSLEGGALDACRRLRAAGGEPSCVLVALTDRGEVRHLESLLAAGADDFLAVGSDGAGLAARLAVLERRAGTLGSRTRTGEGSVPASQAPAAEGLRQTVELLQAVFDDAADGIIIADAQTKRFLRGNPAILQMLGYSEDELLHRSVMDIHPSEVSADVIGQFESMRAGRITSAKSVPCLRKDGSVFYADIDGSRVVYQGRECMIGVFRDVTAQSLAADALAESESRFRAIFESAALGIAVTDMEGRLQECNAQFAEMLGYRVPELLGKHISEISHSEDWTAEIPLFRQLQSGVRDTIQLEKRYLHRNGRAVWGRLSASVVFGSDGKPDFVMGLVEDVTGRRQAEEQLQAAVAHSPVATLVVSSNGDVLSYNRAMEELSGYGAEEFRTVYDAIDRFFPDPERRQRAARDVEEGLRGKRPDQNEYEITREDGRTCVVQLHVSYFEGGCVAQLLDVTERNNAIDRLRQSEERYRLIADNATDMIWTAKLEGIDDVSQSVDAASARRAADQLMGRWQFTYVSPSVGRSLGYDTDEAIGLGLEEMLTPDSYRRAAEVLVEELTRENDPTSDPGRMRLLELQHLTKDGAVRWCEVTTTFLRNDDGSIAGILGATRDITERRRAEAALRESEATLRSLVENMPDMVAVSDREGRIEYVNRSLDFGSMEFCSGAEGLNFIKPEYHELARRTLRRLHESEEVQHMELMDSAGRWWSCRVVPRVEDGEIRSIISIATDITERKAAEEAVQKEQELLRQLLELHERDRELLAFELHDGFAQQLVGAMMTFEAASQLQDADPEQARASFREGARVLRESIEESRRLVGGLRPPVLDEFGIVAAIEHLVEQSQSLGGQQIELVCRGQFQRMARPLESAIFRIVQETLNNASNHSQSHSVRVELAREGDHVRVTVRDWGVGFDPERVHERCFGLRGIRERARLLGGQAAVQTAPGAGTCVDVTLPLVQRSQGTRAAR